MINEMREFVLELVQSEYETSNQLVETKDEFEQLCADEGVRCTNAMWDLYQKYHMEGLDNLATEESDEILEEALSNKEKLKRAYPELNFDNHAAETLTEAVGAEDKMQTAVGILFDMDNFTLSVRDNGYWLSMGVPDGEFDEDDRDLAEANYKEHEWLIEDDGFDREAFKDLLDAFKTATRRSDYDQSERARIIHEAEVILNMNESVEDMDKRCEECNALLNDMGKCPKCDEGEEESLQEASISDTINKLDAKLAKDKRRKADHLQALIVKTLSPDNRYYYKGDIVDYKTFAADLNKVKTKLDSDILTLTKDDPNYGLIRDIINTVVIDKTGWIIRRGLELIRSGKLPYRPDRGDLLEIGDNFRAEYLLGAESNDAADSEQVRSEVETASAEEQLPNEVDSENSEAENSGSDNEVVDNPIKLPEWLTDAAIKAAIALLAKRKNGSAKYFDKDGNLIDYKKINIENILDVFTDKEATKPFINALEQVKAGLARRKAAAIKSAALFGESYDDSLEYEEIDENELTEDITSEELEALINASKNVANSVMDQAGDIALKALENHDCPIAALNSYADTNLGDIEPLDEVFSEPAPLTEGFLSYAAAEDELTQEKLSYEQLDNFNRIMQTAANAFDVSLDTIVIFKDFDREFDPAYFVDAVKELSRGILLMDVFDMQVVRAEFRHNPYIIFKNQSDAHAYVAYAR